jgi:SAM-dependent methyltransferase
MSPVTWEASTRPGVSPGRELDGSFDRFLALPLVDRDPYTRHNLNVFRPRHVLMARSIERYLAGPRNAIADIGCQNGFFLRYVAPMGFTRFLAVDYFEIPPERSFLTGLEGVEFVRTNFNADGFLGALADSSVDCVVSTEVLEHIYHHPLGYLRECWRVLRPGGLLLLSTPNPCTLANAWRLATGRAVSWGGVDFARTPKITPEGLPLAVWEVHFREYAPSELDEVVAELPDARVLERGFIATGVDPAAPLPKRLAKSLQWSLGLGRFRPLCTTQYQVLQRGDAGPRPGPA